MNEGAVSPPPFRRGRRRVSRPRSPSTPVDVHDLGARSLTISNAGAVPSRSTSSARRAIWRGVAHCGALPACWPQGQLHSRADVPPPGEGVYNGTVTLVSNANTRWCALRHGRALSGHALLRRDPRPDARCRGQGVVGAAGGAHAGLGRMSTGLVCDGDGFSTAPSTWASARAIRGSSRPVRTFLNREPDAGQGLLAQPVRRRVTREVVLVSFMFSAEFGSSPPRSSGIRRCGGSWMR